MAVSDPETKQRIREAAEKEEHAFYSGRAPQEWIDALAPLGTDEHKPHLTDAPWVVVLFRQAHGVDRRRQQAHPTTTRRNRAASPPGSSSPRCT